MTHKDINKIIEALQEFDPISFKEIDKEISYEEREGLAHAYANAGYRSYMERTINHLILNSATRSEDEIGMIYRKGGIVFLKQLFSVQKSMFEDYQKINKIRKQ